MLFEPFPCISAYQSRVLFVTGPSKNTGKTTCLNYLAMQARRAHLTPALMSVGIDGDRQLSQKPAIYIAPGDCALSGEQLLRTSGILPELLEILPDRSAFGRLCLARAQRAGSVVLVSPEGNAGVMRAVEKARELADVVLVDGAINRMTQITSWPDAAFLYVVRADTSNFEAAVHQIEHLHLLLSCPLIDSTPGIFCDEPLTKARAGLLPQNDAPVDLLDFTKIFLQLGELKALLKRRAIRVKHRISCAGIVLWLRGISQARVLQALPGSLSVPVFANPYEI